MNDHPRLQAVLLAQHVYSDAATGMKVLAGTYNTLKRPKFPSKISLGDVFIVVTDVFGALTLSVKFVDLKDLAVLVECRVELPPNSDNGGVGIELSVHFGEVEILHSGTYAVEVYSRNELLGSVRLFMQDSTS